MRTTSLLLLATCVKPTELPAPTPTEAPPPQKIIRFEEDLTIRGLKMELKDATPAASTTEQLPLPPTITLTAAETAALLSRLPGLESPPTADFALRPASSPPPRTGATIVSSFPPPPAGPPPTVAPAALSVLRYAPTGEVPIAPHLSVTFDKAMVAISSREEAASHIPLTLTPTIPGAQWQWLGAKTLLFSMPGAQHLPMATEYKVEIPAGTRSINGDILEKVVSFAFSTPPITLKESWPSSDSTELEPTIYLAFDQDINAEAILQKLKLSGDSRTVALRMATTKEKAGSYETEYPDSRELYLRPIEPLTRATWYTLTLPAGSPSAEGPRLTTKDQNVSFRTYDPLKIDGSGCGWDRDCPPTATWSVWFNNSLDAEHFDPSWVKVEPEVPGLNIQASGGYISLQGDTTGRTTYTVKIAPELVDRFGQTLGKEAVLSWKVGPAEKTLEGPGKDMVVLDPAGGAKFSVWSTNHASLRVRVWRQSPENWDDWQKWMQKRNWENRYPGPPPGERLQDTVIPVAGSVDRRTETAIDLAQFSAGGIGQYLVWIEPTIQPKGRWNHQEVLAWVQVTNIGLAAFADQTELLTWASRLSDGASLDGVSLSLLSTQSMSQSNKDGLAVLNLPETVPFDVPDVLVAKRGNDLAILPREPSWYNYGRAWIKTAPGDELKWYVFDDRGLYRPGEEVRVKGWLRQNNPREGGSIGALERKGQSVSWVLKSSRGIELGKGEAKVSGLGGFDIKLTLPSEADLGEATLQLDAQGSGLSNWRAYHTVRIEEFRRPEFEVSTSTSPGPFLLGEDAELSVSASYYAGGGLPAAEVYWSAYASDASYVPPGRSDWSFGRWSPWWMEWSPEGGTTEGAVSLQSKTDSTGQHHAALHFTAMNPPRPMNVHAEARVMDVNRQEWTAGSELLVHPASRYVGLKSPRNFVSKGDPVEVDALVVDLEGKEVSGTKVDIVFSRMVSGWKNGRWSEQAEAAGNCTITDTGHCSFKPEVGGSYQVLARLTDPEGRKNESELRLWVEGDAVPSRDLTQQQVTLVPDQQEHQPGDTAKIMVQAPFYPAEALVTFRRSGVVETRRFRMEEPTAVVEVPIEEAYIPDLMVQVDLVGSSPRTDDKGQPAPNLPPRAAFATGAVTFKIPPLSRSLKVEAKAPAALSPGSQTEIALSIKDAFGKPVANAELAVVVADESVLALTGYRLPDPLELFYSARGAGVLDTHLRNSVVLGNPDRLVLPTEGVGASTGSGGGDQLRQLESTGYLADDVSMAREMPASSAAPGRMKSEKKPADAPMEEQAVLGGALRGEGTETGGSTEPITLRSDFNALALFAPEVTTDASGNAVVPLKLPDSLTRYRIMVVAVSGGQQFGMAESAITARLPLMVRPSAPRFLNFGDRFELPVVLQNQTDVPMTVEVAVKAGNIQLYEKLPVAAGAAGGSDTAGRRVTVPANDRIEVRFPAAAMRAGTAAFQIAASTRESSDAATFTLPVWTPATTEAFATYGEVDKGATVQPVAAPKDVWPQFGGLEITTSSTQLQALTDAVLYLVSYPFDCNEQLASRILAVGGLRDVLSAFSAEGLPDAKTLEASVENDLARLNRRQNWDGGFAFWRKGDPSWPYLSIHVGVALSVAKNKGYEIPGNLWSSNLHYLRNIRSHLPYWYSEEAKRWLRAFALGARHRMGDDDVAAAAQLWKEAGKTLPLEAQGWLWPVLAKKPEGAEIRANIMSKVEETAAGAMFVTGMSDSDYLLLNSDRRTDAVILDAMIEVEPQNDVIPKVVRGLLGHKKAGRWYNTQENAYVLLALDHYFRVYEKETPDFVARAWLGEGYAGDHTFKGRTTERGQINIPMQYLMEQPGQQDLTLQRDGSAGRLYYRVGMRYAPESLELEPVDAGFVVQRVYEAVDNPGDVRRDEDGTWHIKAGARVKVKLTMVAQARRYHVALVDPLPAGLEVLNPALAVTGTLPDDPSKQSPWYWWQRTWYEHENFRDDRVEAFTSLLWDGVWDYSYFARATTPGIFVVPPSKAEEMYNPETFGRAGTDRVVVE